MLKAVAARYVMFRPEAQRRHAAQKRLLIDLVEKLVVAPNRLDPSARDTWDAATDDDGRRRVVIDQVAQLTDTAARAWHRAD